MSLLGFYLGSKELKKAIVDLSFKHDIPLKFLCAEAKINFKIFMQGYVNSNTYKEDLPVTEKQFEKIFELLGIDRRVQFVIKSNFDAEKVKNELEAKHGGEKKRTDTLYRFGDQGLG